MDAAELVCLLQAATRLDPNLAEAWRQQYDLLRGLGRGDQAIEALQKYTDLVPDDEVALLTLAGERINAGQTAEKRLEICRQWLSRKDLPDAVTGYVLRTSAEIEHNRLQDEQALRHAQHAVAVFPYDITSQRLLVDLQGSADLASELNLDLWTVRANPADAAAIIDVGRIADGLGLYADATQWYLQARTLLKHFRQDTNDLTLQLADHWLAADQPEQALQVLQPITDEANSPSEAHLLAAEAYILLGKPKEAREAASKALRQQAATQPAASTAPEEVHARALAAAQVYSQNAWIRMMYLGNGASEVDATEAAFKLAPDQAWARRCFGWALLKAGQPDRAIEILKPIAGTDAWAALGMAQAQHAKGNPQLADESLQQLQRLTPTGPAYRAAAAWAKTAGLPMPEPGLAVQQRAQKLLAGFEKDLFDLPIEPGRFLRMKLIMDAPPAAGKPWFGQVELTNISTVPIYCGPYSALMPNVLLTATVADPAVRDIGHQLLLSMQRQFVLKPGQTLSLHRPLDSGPLHEVLRNPAKKVLVIFRLILDPIRTATGTWMPGPAGLGSEPVEFTRPAADLPDSGDLLRQARSGSQAQKIDAVRWITCIFAGRMAGSQTQSAATPQDPLTQAMAALLADRDPLVAAHALSLPAQTPLIEPIFQAAMPRVNDENWLVRLLAVRFFAHEQGEKFTRALKGVSRSDPDPLVRSLMAAYYADFVAKGRR